MPYKVTKKGNKYCVVKTGSGKEMGCHDTEAKAKAQMGAIMAAEADVEELDFSAMNMHQQMTHIRRSFYEWWKETFNQEDWSIYCQDIYQDHPILGSVLIVDFRGDLYSVTFVIDEAGAILFSDRDAWVKMMMTYVPVDEMPMADEPAMSETLAEASTGHVVEIVEAGKADDGPVKLRIIPIQAGPGNKRDGHYYPLDVIKRDIGVFEGAKMYATDHKQDEKSTLTEVATVLKAPDGFAESGEPYALVGVHDPNFAKSIRNRATLGTLGKLNVSILGKGNARAGKIGEASYKIVESISEGKAIDFVTSAGAGGHAVALAESEDGMSDKEKKDDLEEVEISEQDETPPEEVEEPPEVKPLTAEEAKAILAKSGLQETSQAHLAEATYADEDALRRAIFVEKQYLSVVLNAGKPVDMGESGESVKPIDPAKRKEILEEAKARANAAVFGGVTR